MNHRTTSRPSGPPARHRERAGPRWRPAAVALSLVAGLQCGPASADRARTDALIFDDPTGAIATVSVTGTFDTTGAFFQSLGTNGRSCSTCHDARQAFSIVPRGIRKRYIESRGSDPLFAAVDGANCPTGSRSRAADHSLLLGSGLIRVGLKLPANAEYTLTVVHDPYGCAVIPDSQGGPPTVSVYRRPLPTTNLGFLSAIMFDGRETVAPLNDGASFMPNLVADLTHQAISATTGHAEATQAPTAAQLADIVNFELALYTAQWRDDAAGSLSDAGATGGPAWLSNQVYFPGINDSLGNSPDGRAFDPASMTAYAGWASLASRRHGDDDRNAARRAIAAGEALFNGAPMQISNVRGLNDNAALGKPTSFVGHCTTCHDTPNVGNHSLPLPLDIGTGHSPLPGLESDPAIAAAIAELGMPDLPVYLISGCPSPFAAGQPESFYTSDPGKALLTGRCSDFNRIKGPVLRGLAARAPYFHNGAAANLDQLVNFYNQRFQMNLTAQQKAQLVAFLNAL